MKKFTILFSVLFACISAFATNGDNKSERSAERHPQHKNVVFKKAQSNELMSTKSFSKKNNSLNRTSQAPFFSEVFAGGIPPTWQNIDSSGSGVRWTWTTIGTYNNYLGNDSLSTSGTSATNGYLMYDSDSAGQTIQGNYGVLITDVIDCSLHPSVRVNFNEFFTKYNAASPIYQNTARVYVSIDGTNWTMIHAADAGLANNDETSNPLAVSVDISSIAAGQATVYLKFSFTGDYSYWWFVDDLELSEVPSVDAGILGIIDPFNGCLLSSAENIIIGVENSGLDSLHDIPVSYSINGGTPVTEMITDTIAPGNFLIYAFSTTANLSAPAVYNIVSYVAYPGDVTSSNDTVGLSTQSAAPNAVPYTMGFETTDDYSGYTMDDVDGDGITVDISSTFSRTGAACLRFPVADTSVVNADNWIISNCFDFTTVNTYNLSLWYKLFDFASLYTPYNLEAYIGTSTDISSMTLLSAFAVPTDTAYNQGTTNFTVPANGTYYLALRVYATNVEISMRVDDISVDIATGIKNPSLQDAVMVYPNPSQGKIFVVNKGQIENGVTINVINTIGQIVATKNSNNFVNETIDLSAQPDGLYTVQVRTSSGIISKTVMVSTK